MSEKDQEVANIAMQEFAAKIITADRLGVISEMVKSLDLVPQELRDEAQVIFTKMVAHLDQ